MGMIMVVKYLSVKKYQERWISYPDSVSSFSKFFILVLFLLIC